MNTDALDEMLRGLGDSRPVCYANFAVFHLNSRKPDNPCLQCTENANCQEIHAWRYDRQRIATRQECFGDSKQHNVRGMCEVCEINNECANAVQIVADERSKESPPRTSVATSALDAPMGVAGALPQPVVAKAETLPAIEYRFPMKDPEVTRELEGIATCTTETLRERLNGLFFRDPTCSGGPKPYSEIRALVCAINIRLNELGELLPRMRPARKHKFVRNMKPSQDMSDLSNDLQVIDLHWLSLHGRAEMRPAGKTARIFSGGAFDVVAASQFVKKNDKVSRLGLTELGQLMMSVVNSKRADDRWIAILGACRDAELTMLANSRQDRSRFDAGLIPARREEYMALRMASGQVKTATEILSLIAGRTIRPSLMQRRRDWFVGLGLQVI